MVTGASCVAYVLLSLAISTALSTSPSTPRPDEVAASEEGAEMVKRLGGSPHDPILRYLMMAMSDSGPRYSQPQLLNRGVRRMGSEFLGKRASSPYPRETYDGEQTCEDNGPCGVESAKEENLKKEQLSFTGQFDYDGGPTQVTKEDLYNAKAKRMVIGDVQPHWGTGPRGDLSHFFSIYMPQDIGSEFLGKRMGSEFLGKRAMGSEFLGKRALGSEFLGKRVMGSEFLGKRALGSEFLGKRAMGSEFLGKRAMGSEFLGKRAMGSEFLGKRAMGSEFLGKRAMGSEFLGKRAMGSEFLGKRAMGSEFLGKRQQHPDLWQKRAVGSEFLG